MQADDETEMREPEPFRPRRAVVTGASSGIGASFARRLADAGCDDVLLVARRSDRLEALATALRTRGVRAETLVADLASESDIGDLAKRLADEPFDLLVNNAGVGGYGHFAEVPSKVVRDVTVLNALTCLLLTRAVLPGMLRRGTGAVVNIASMLAFSGSEAGQSSPSSNVPRATYSASKAFLVTFTRKLAAELVDTGVHVQVCCPGPTATEFHQVAVGETTGDGSPSKAFMTADDVVTASMAALQAKEVVCLPGVEDQNALMDYDRAETALRAAHTHLLPPRYRNSRNG